MAALWVRSYFAKDMFLFENTWDANGWTYLRQGIVQCGRGGVGFYRSVSAHDRTFFQPRLGRQGRGPRASTRPIAHGTHVAAWPAYPEFRFGDFETSALGFKWGRYTLPNVGSRPGQRAIQVVVPIWVLVAWTALLPALVLWKHMSRPRRPQTCSKCAYDLTGNISGTCPECGTRITGRNVVKV